MVFCEALRLARSKVGLSQRALAKLMGIPNRTFESWEIGERVPPKYVQVLILEKVQSMIPNK